MNLTSSKILEIDTLSDLVICLKALAKRDSNYRKDGKPMLTTQPYVFIGDVFKPLSTVLTRLVVTRLAGGIGLQQGVAKKLDTLGVVVSVLPHTMIGLSVGDAEFRIYISPE